MNEKSKPYDYDRLKVCPVCGQEMKPDLIQKDGRGIQASRRKADSPEMIAGYGFYCYSCQRGWTGTQLRDMLEETERGDE